MSTIYSCTLQYGNSCCPVLIQREDAQTKSTTPGQTAGVSSEAVNTGVAKALSPEGLRARQALAQKRMALNREKFARTLPTDLHQRQQLEAEYTAIKRWGGGG